MTNLRTLLSMQLFTRMKTSRTRQICVETCQSRLNIRNYVTSCIHTRPSMWKFGTETSL